LADRVTKRERLQHGFGGWNAAGEELKVLSLGDMPTDLARLDRFWSTGSQ
jgi:hypothetical protein